MPTCQPITSVTLIVALVVTVEAGTDRAPKGPIDKMLAEIRKDDPKGFIVAALRSYPGIPLGKPTDNLQIIVNNNFYGHIIRSSIS
jgi:hypothetical protein